MSHCEVDGCVKPVDREGVCFHHRVSTVGVTGLHHLKRTRNTTIAEENRDTIAQARSVGHDPVPITNYSGGAPSTPGQLSKLKEAVSSGI